MRIRSLFAMGCYLALMFCFVAAPGRANSPVPSIEWPSTNQRAQFFWELLDDGGNEYLPVWRNSEPIPFQLRFLVSPTAQLKGTSLSAKKALWDIVGGRVLTCSSLGLRFVETKNATDARLYVIVADSFVNAIVDPIVARVRQEYAETPNWTAEGFDETLAFLDDHGQISTSYFTMRSRGELDRVVTIVVPEHADNNVSAFWVAATRSLFPLRYSNAVFGSYFNQLVHKEMTFYGMPSVDAAFLYNMYLHSRVNREFFDAELDPAERKRNLKRILRHLVDFTDHAGTRRSQPCHPTPR